MLHRIYQEGAKLENDWTTSILAFHSRPGYMSNCMAHMSTLAIDQDRFDFAGIAKMPEPTCDLAGVRRVADIRL